LRRAGGDPTFVLSAANRIWVLSPTRHGLWVPETSSTSCDQPIFVDQASDASVSSDCECRKHRPCHATRRYSLIMPPAAVYFCCLEALQNTTKYSHATQACIALQAQNGTLCFTVSDDGTGYDTHHTPVGPACGTWPTGSPHSAAGSKSGPLPARAPPSPGTSPSCACRKLRPRHATRRYSLIRPPRRVCFRMRCWSRLTGSGSGFSGAAACRKRCGRC
jgi:hypothetical protein